MKRPNARLILEVGNKRLATWRFHYAGGNTLVDSNLPETHDIKHAVGELLQLASFDCLPHEWQRAKVLAIVGCPDSERPLTLTQEQFVEQLRGSSAGDAEDTSDLPF